MVALRVVAYARASRADEDRVQAQLDVIEEWATAGGHEVVARHSDDGVAGDLIDRPGLQAALADLEGADALAVRDLDRLARALHVQEAILDAVWKDDAEVIEAKHDRPVLRDDPDDPMRRFVRQVMGAAAELERNMVRARLRAGLRRKGARGGYVGGLAVPFGKRVVEGVFADEPAERRVIERIHDLRHGGLTWREVAQALNCAGVPTRLGGRWHPTTVCRIATRENL